MARHLVLSGGGTRGATYVGCFKCLKDTFGIDYGLRTHELKTIVATSIGSVFGLMLVCGLSIEEIEDIVRSFQFSETVDFNFDFWSGLSLSDGTAFRKVLSGYIQRLCTACEGLTCDDDSEEVISCEQQAENMTLKKLYEKTKIDFICTSASVEHQTARYFRYKTDPNMKVVDAVFASCCVPFVYRALEYNSEHFLDGGLVNNFPMNVLDAGDYDPSEVLGIRLLGSLDNSNLSSNYFRYIIRVFIVSEAAINRIMYDVLREPYKNVTITIEDEKSRNPQDFLSCEKSDIDEYIKLGYTSMKTFIESKSLSYPA